jgi:hypothetical protein
MKQAKVAIALHDLTNLMQDLVCELTASDVQLCDGSVLAQTRKENLGFIIFPRNFTESQAFDVSASSQHFGFKKKKKKKKS